MSKCVENRGLDEKLFRKTLELAENIKALKNMNITLKYVAPGKAGFEMTAAEEYSNSRSTLHGGIIATFADTVMGFAGISLGSMLVTLEMNLNYFAPVQIGETITAEAEVIHAGQTTVVAEANLYNGSNKLVSKSRGTYFPVGRLCD